MYFFEFYLVFVFSLLLLFPFKNRLKVLYAVPCVNVQLQICQTYMQLCQLSVLSVLNSVFCAVSCGSFDLQVRICVLCRECGTQMLYRAWYLILISNRNQKVLIFKFFFMGIALVCIHLLGAFKITTIKLC